MAGKTYYVSGTGNDKNDGLKEGNAFRTLQKAANLVKAGDTVYVMNGTYTESKYPNSAVLTLSDKHGTANAPIKFIAYSGHNPLIKSSNLNAIRIAGSSYIAIEGLTLVGSNDEITLKYALEQKDKLNNPLTLGNGIAITYINGKTNIHSHHIVIKGNNISKFGGGGIATSQADYITIENNVVTETALYSPYGNSGISNLQNWNFDNNTTDYKMIIRGNVVYNNESLIPWYKVGKITEGHGIMIDDAKHAGTDKIAYTGKTLVANNTIYNNGGAALNVYNSSNVDVVNNTTYHNAQHPDVEELGEISVLVSDRVKVVNNIMYAKTNGVVNLVHKSQNITTDKNLVYNSSKFNKSGTNYITGIDPQFIDAAKGNFGLKSGSAAIDAGSSAFNGISTNVLQDGDGNGSKLIDIGAHEAPANTVKAPEIQVLNDKVDIVDGSTTAIDFGKIVVGSTLTKTFTINNTGTGALNLSNLQLPKGFSLVGTLPASVATNASTTLVVALDTTTPGTYTGQLSLNNNDANESPFDFAISGTVNPAPTPEIPVLNGTNLSETLDGKAPANKIYGFGGQDIIIGDVGKDQLWGGDGDDRLWGQDSDDLLYGDSGNDQLRGDNGNDTLFGGLGNDQLHGRAGNDWLYGDKGNDVLTGSYGIDTFVLASGDGTDSITDFKLGTDLIALSGGLKFGQLSIQQQGSQSLIVNSSDNQVLAKLDTVSTVSLLAQASTTFITI